MQLPHRSGDVRLYSLDADDRGVRDTLGALQELSRHRLAYVIRLLHTELETVIKLPSEHNTTPASFSSNASRRAAAPTNLLSQMFIAQIMARCVQHYRDRPKDGLAETEEIHSMDDRTAKQLLGTVSFFLKQYAVHHEAEGQIRPWHAPTSDPPCNKHRTYVFAAPSSAEEVMAGIMESAASITRCISISRWDIMLKKLRNRLDYYSSSDESPDLSEVGLFELCSLDQHRLSGLFGELSIFPNLKRTAQVALASAVRSALAKFLHENPLTLQTMYEEQRRMAFSGQAEVLFDLIFPLSDSSKRKAILWPLLSILLALCPDVVTKMVLPGGSGGMDIRSPVFAKKILFLDTIRKAGRSVAPHAGNEDASVALACYAELCKAASFTSPPQDSQASALRLLVLELDLELRRQALDPALFPTLLDGSTNVELVRQALDALSLLQYSYVSTEVLPRFLARSSSYQTKILALQAGRDLLSQGQAAPWHPLEETIVRDIRESVMNILHGTITSVFGQDAKGQATFKPNTRFLHQLGDEESEYSQLVAVVLEIIAICPALALPQDQRDSESLSSVGWTADRLLRSHEDSLSRTIALLSCLSGAVYHRSIRRQSIVTMLTVHGFVTQSTDERGNWARQMMPCEPQIAIALGQIVLRALSNGEEALQALRIYAVWLGQLADYVAAQLEYAEVLRHTEACSEAIGIASLCGIHEAMRNSSQAFFAALGRLAKGTADASNSNLPEIERVLTSEVAPILGGTIAHAKHHLKVFKAIKQATPGLQMAWSEIRRRWIVTAGVFGVPGYADSPVKQSESSFATPSFDREPIDDTHISQWIQLSGFLISTLGLYIGSPGLDAAMLASAESLLGYTLGDIPKQDMASLCLKDMVNLLDSEHHRIRDSMREMLAGDLDPAFLPAIIKIFRSTLEGFIEYGRLETASSEVTLFFDQSLIVLSGLLARRTPGNSGDEAFDLSYIEDHLLAAAYYVNRQETSSSSSRLEIQICKAMEALYRIVTIMHLRQPSARSSRNTLSRFLLHFVEEAAAEVDKHAHELILHASTALQHCLAGLIVHRPEAGRETSQAASDIALVTAYYERISRLLDSAASTKVKGVLLRRGSFANTGSQTAEAASWPLHGRVPSSEQIGLVKHKELQQSYQSNLRLALSHILTANLPQSLPLVSRLAREAGNDIAKAAILKEVMHTWPTAQATHSRGAGGMRHFFSGRRWD